MVGFEVGVVVGGGMAVDVVVVVVVVDVADVPAAARFPRMGALGASLPGRSVPLAALEGTRVDLVRLTVAVPLRFAIAALLRAFVE